MHPQNTRYLPILFSSLVYRVITNPAITVTVISAVYICDLSLTSTIISSQHKDEATVRLDSHATLDNPTDYCMLSVALGFIVTLTEVDLTRAPSWIC